MRPDGTADNERANEALYGATPRRRSVTVRGASPRTLGQRTIGSAQFPACLALVVAGLSSAAYAGDVVWGAGSTQFVNSTLTISDFTLRVEPGVTVLVSPGASIVVSGTGAFEVEGSADAPVLFQTNGAGRWNGIAFQAGSSGWISHATIEQIEGTGLSIAHASPMIEHCVVQDVLGAGSVARGIFVTGVAAHPVIHRSSVLSVAGHIGTPGSNASNASDGADGADGTLLSPHGKNGSNGGNGATGAVGGAGGGAVGIDVAAGARPGIASTRVDLVVGGAGAKGGNGGAGGDGGDGGTPVDGIFTGSGGHAGDGGNGGNGGAGGIGGFAVGMRFDGSGSTVPSQCVVTRVFGGLSGSGGNGAAAGDGGTGGPGIAFTLTPAFNTDGGDGGDGGNAGSGGAGGVGGVARLFEITSANSSLRLVQSTLAENKGGNGGNGGFASFAVGFGGSGGGAVSPGVPGGSGSGGSPGSGGAPGIPGAREGARVAAGSDLSIESSIVALGGAAAGTSLIATGSAVVDCATTCLFGYATASTGTVNFLGGTMFADPLLVDPASGEVSLQASSPCIDTGSTSIVPFDRVASSFLAATEVAEVAAYDEFAPGIANGSGCLVDPTLPVVLDLNDGTMTVTGLNAGGNISCAITDASTTPQVSDGSLTSGTVTLRIEFDPPVRGFYSYFASVAVGAAPRMRVYAGATLLDDVVGSNSQHATASVGLGVSRLGGTFDRVELSVNGDTLSVAGAGFGLAANEPSLGTVTILRYAGPAGPIVANDVAVAFEDGQLMDAAGLPRLVAGSGQGFGPIDIGAREYQIVEKEEPCPADLNGNGAVDSADLAMLLGAWGTSGPGDLNDNGMVDAGDLALLLGGFGACP